MPKALDIDVSNIISQEPAPNADLTPEPAKAAPATTEDASTEPAAAPVADAAKPDAVVPDKLELTKDPDPVDVKATGVKAFDAVGKMLGEKGVVNANAIMDSFIEDGELSLEAKAEMIEALGEGVASMAFDQMEAAAESIISEAKVATTKTLDYAVNKFPGSEAETVWGEIQAYVRSKESGFSDAELATMNTMLDAGGLQAELVIDRIQARYAADAGNSLPGTLLEGDSGSTGLTFEPISRIDYTAEMGKAVGKYGEDSHQVNELNRRREKSMQLGY